MQGWTMDVRIPVTRRSMIHAVRDAEGTCGSAFQTVHDLPGGALRLFRWRTPDGVGTAAVHADVILDPRVLLVTQAITKLSQSGGVTVARRPTRTAQA